MNKNEIKSIDLDEQICSILANKKASTLQEIARKFKITEEKINEIIKDNNLYFKAAWLKYDKEVDSLDATQKRIDKRRLEIESELENELNLLEGGKQGRT